MTAADLAELEDHVKPAEGLRLKAYQDSKGVWTVGYGTNLQELTINEALAQMWLTEKLAACAKEATSAFPWFVKASKRRQMAITEMLYNMGLPRVLGFKKMLAACADGDWSTAADEALDSKWAREDVGPTRSQRIAEWLRNG